jgi:hypothetical protein
MINFFAGLFALAFGIGLALWICGSMLDKSNNIGDSRGDSKTYNAEATFTSKCNRMEKTECTTYVQHNLITNDTNGPSGTEQVRRLTEEERRKKAEAEKKANIPKGAFVSKNTSAEDKYDVPDWEKRAERYY